MYICFFSFLFSMEKKTTLSYKKNVLSSDQLIALYFLAKKFTRSRVIIAQKIYNALFNSFHFDVSFLERLVEMRRKKNRAWTRGKIISTMKASIQYKTKEEMVELYNKTEIFERCSGRFQLDKTTQQRIKAFFIEKRFEGNNQDAYNIDGITDTFASWYEIYCYDQILKSHIKEKKVSWDQWKFNMQALKEKWEVEALQDGSLAYPLCSLKFFIENCFSFKNWFFILSSNIWGKNEIPTQYENLLGKTYHKPFYMMLLEKGEEVLGEYDEDRYVENLLQIKKEIIPKKLVEISWPKASQKEEKENIKKEETLLEKGIYCQEVWEGFFLGNFIVDFLPYEIFLVPNEYDENYYEKEKKYKSDFPFLAQ